jgi:hypothetical protein
MRRALVVACAFLCAGFSCQDAPPLVIEGGGTLEADGASTLTLRIVPRDPIEGAMVQLTSSGGLLASSAVPLVDGEASVVLTAPLERELGRAEQRTITVTAAIVLDEDTRIEGLTSVSAVAPAQGPPLLFVDADPPASVAGRREPVRIHVVARRVAPGASLSVETSAGTLDNATVAVGDDGTADAFLAGPATPADVTVTVTEPASGVRGSVVVRFVNEGDPLFDLSGSFAQIGPARVKLESGALTPNPQCAVAPSLVLARFTQTGLDLDAHDTTCDVTFPPVTSIVGTVTNEATDAFYAAIPVVDAAFTLPSGDLGASYEPPPSIVVVGADLDDPEHDELPTDETDPRVVDADDDGEPGVTVQNSLGGAQHIVFRNISVGTGRVLSSNHIVGDEPGDLLATTETSVFGIGGSFLPDTTALGSVVELVRIDGRFGSVDADADNDGEVTCAELLDVAAAVTTLEAPDTPFDCGGDR